MHAQIVEGTNLQRVAAAAAPALAALLRAIHPPQREQCEGVATCLLRSFMYLCTLVALITCQDGRCVPGPAPDTVAKFWQGAVEHP